MLLALLSGQWAWEHERRVPWPREGLRIRSMWSNDARRRRATEGSWGPICTHTPTGCTCTSLGCTRRVLGCWLRHTPTLRLRSYQAPRCRGRAYSRNNTAARGPGDSAVCWQMTSMHSGTLIIKTSVHCRRLLQLSQAGWRGSPKACTPRLHHRAEGGAAAAAERVPDERDVAQLDCTGTKRTKRHAECIVATVFKGHGCGAEGPHE